MKRLFCLYFISVISLNIHAHPFTQELLDESITAAKNLLETPPASPETKDAYTHFKEELSRIGHTHADSLSDKSLLDTLESWADLQYSTNRTAEEEYHNIMFIAHQLGSQDARDDFLDLHRIYEEHPGLAAELREALGSSIEAALAPLLDIFFPPQVHTLKS